MRAVSVLVFIISALFAQLGFIGAATFNVFPLQNQFGRPAGIKDKAARPNVGVPVIRAKSIKPKSGADLSGAAQTSEAGAKKEPAYKKLIPKMAVRIGAPQAVGKVIASTDSIPLVQEAQPPLSLFGNLDKGALTTATATATATALQHYNTTNTLQHPLQHQQLHQQLHPQLHLHPLQHSLQHHYNPLQLPQLQPQPQHQRLPQP